MQLSWFLKILMLVGVLIFSACDSSSLDTTTPDSDLTPPTTDATATLGPVTTLVTTDVLNELNDIADSIDEYVEEATDTGGGGPTENLVRTVSGEDSAIETTITIDHGTVDCDEGGNRQFFGTLDLVSNGSSEGGSAGGTLTFQYNNCIDIALLETSDGLCSMTTAINGTITTTVDLTYGELDPFDDTDVNITADSASSAPLDITIASTASEQAYSFSHAISASSTNDNLDGTVTMDNEVYDIVEILDFIESTTASVLCP
jgi:hypothetical protein